MSVTALPDWPGPALMTPVLVDFGGVQQGPTGGAAERLDRAGNRWRMEFAMPPLEHDANGRTWAARLVKAQRTGARVEIPLTAGNQGSPGIAAVVDGAGQAGLTLAVRGIAPGWSALEGYWLSVMHAGRHHVHMITTPLTVGASGEATFDIEPMLRVPLADGAVVHLAAPSIEGLLIGNERSWTVNAARHVGLSFAIQERI